MNQAEQDVLGPDAAVVEKARFFLGQDEDPAGAVGKSLKRGYKCGTPRSYLPLVSNTSGPSRQTQYYGWAMTPDQIGRALAEAGAPSPSSIDKTRLKVGTTQKRDESASVILKVRWYPNVADVQNDLARVWVSQVPRDELGPIRDAFKSVVIPELAAWLTNAEQAGDSWQAIHHGRVWRWRDLRIEPRDYNQFD